MLIIYVSFWQFFGRSNYLRLDLGFTIVNRRLLFSRRKLLFTLTFSNSKQRTKLSLMGSWQFPYPNPSSFSSHLLPSSSLSPFASYPSSTSLPLPFFCSLPYFFGSLRGTIFFGCLFNKNVIILCSNIQ